MIEYPNIKGVKWEYPEHPELVALKYITIDSNDEEMGITPKEYLREGLFDISKIVSIKDFFHEKDLTFAVENECVIGLVGEYINVFRLSKENAIKMWLFYKSITKKLN